MSFNPIAASAYGLEADPSIATTPWVIPEGDVQSIVSDEADLDIYVDDWHDMNTVNETGKHAGRYIYRTHEVRGGAIGNDGNSLRIDGGSGGAVSVVDLKNGISKEVVGRADWEALDGIVWTPWRTVLFAEEVGTAARPDPDAPQALAGLVYELKLDKHDLMAAESVTVRPMLGALAHEGLEIDAEGNVYVIDEDRTGSIYKFVPTTYGNLSSGQLYALKVKNGAKTGEAEWVAFDMTQAQIQGPRRRNHCRRHRVLPSRGHRAHRQHPVCGADLRGRRQSCQHQQDAAGYNVGAVLAVELGDKTPPSGSSLPARTRRTKTMPPLPPASAG